MIVPPLGSYFADATMAAFEDFEAFRRDNQHRLDSLYVYQLSLASAEPTIRRSGACAICLHPTEFTSNTAGGELTERGMVPEWREQQHCGCGFALRSRERVLIHAWLRASMAEQPNLALVVGHAASVGDWLEAHTCPVVREGALDPKTLRLPHGDAAFDVVFSSEYLDQVPQLDRLLAEVHRVLRSRGMFVFTVAFHFLELSTRTVSLDGADSEAPWLERSIHAFGWDILDRLRAAGFIDAQLTMPWSEEFGYIGCFNAVFTAVRP